MSTSASAEQLLNTPGMVEHEYQQVVHRAASPYPHRRRHTAPQSDTGRRATALCSTSQHVGYPARAARVR